MPSSSEALMSLGRSFMGRLPDARLQLAMGYIDFGEEPLALETLCECLCDEVVSISRDEYDEVVRINQSLSWRLSSRMIDALKALIDL